MAESIIKKIDVVESKEITGTTDQYGNMYASGIEKTWHIIGAKISTFGLAIPFIQGSGNWQIKCLDAASMSPRASQNLTLTVYYIK